MTYTLINQKKLKALFIIAIHNPNKEVTIHSDGLTLLTGSSRVYLHGIGWNISSFAYNPILPSCKHTNCGIGGNY